jgi:hypothetical protein
LEQFMTDEADAAEARRRRTPDQSTVADALARQREEATIAKRRGDAAVAAKALDTGSKRTLPGEGSSVVPVDPTLSAYRPDNPSIPTDRPAGPVAGPAAAAPPSSPADAAPSTPPPDDGRTRFVRSSSGKITATNRPPEGDGAGWMDEATALAGIRDPKGKDVLTSKPRGGGAFSRMDAGPYSEKLEGLMGEAPTTPLSAPSRVLEQTPSSIGPWSKSRTDSLSGLEQSLARREWLEGRQRAEQGQEVEEAGQESQVASFARVAEEAKIDPLALAHIAASGKSAPEYLKQEYESGRIANARAVQQYYIPRIEAAVNALKVAATPEERSAIMEGIRALEKQALQGSNIELGRALVEQRPDLISAILGLGGMGGGASAAAPGGAPPG